MKPATTISRTLRQLTLVGAILMLAGGCGGEDNADEQAAEQAGETESADAPAASEKSAGGPSVSVSADKTHAVQPGDEITVTVSVENFTLSADKIGGANEAGVGHYRLYLDEASGEDFLAEAASETVKIKVPDEITDGSHPLRAVLFNNDRTPVEPPSESEVWLIVYRL